MTLTSLCLFCGSRPGSDAAFLPLAAAFGKLCADRGLRLVYGGGAHGLMGAAPRAALAAGGEVVGILPRALMTVEIAQAGLTELVVVAGLHERKAEMFARSDAIVVLPGGIGTTDELFEVLTWRNLGLHAKPVFLLGGAFWQPFLDLLAHIDAQGFAYPGLSDLFEPLAGIAGLAERLASGQGR
ncbi:MAG: TIGR00730 family Rossman fold protein [Janthinobacterium lividum]